MTHRLNHLILLILAVIIGGVASSCANQDDPGIVAPVLYDVVELSAISSPGSTFTLMHNNAPAVTLASQTATVDTARVKIGESLVIRYSIAAADGLYKSVNLLNYYPITNLKLSTAQHAELIGWDDDPIYLVSIWRAGNRVNMETRLPYDKRARQLALVVDNSTLQSAEPHAYLVHLRDEITPTFDRSYYLSVDLSRLWRRSEPQRLVIHIANSNLNQSTFTIERP